MYTSLLQDSFAKETYNFKELTNRTCVYVYLYIYVYDYIYMCVYTHIPN